MSGRRVRFRGHRQKQTQSLVEKKTRGGIAWIGNMLIPNSAY